MAQTAKVKPELNNSEIRNLLLSLNYEKGSKGNHFWFAEHKLCARTYLEGYKIELVIYEGVTHAKTELSGLRARTVLIGICEGV